MDFSTALNVSRERYFEFGPFRLDAAAGVLFRGSRRLPLRPKLIEILAVLVEAKGTLVTKEELLQKVWPGVVVEEGSVTAHISLLRKILEKETGGRTFIETIPKRGYRFAASVKVGSQPQAAVTGPRVMLMVLPFENFSQDKEQEYFSDGLTEEMITQLSRLNPEKLAVIARTSTMQYKSTKKPVQQIGRELGVAYILEGSVRRSRNRVRIAAQLIQVQDQTHVWAENYDRELDDILILQGEVAKAVADQIKVKFLPEKGAASGSRRVNPEAYEAYLKGRYLWNKRTPEAMDKATDLFEKAVAIDTTSALSYSALSDCYAIPGAWSWSAPKTAAHKAKAAAIKALELDSTFAEPHASLGNVLSMFEREWSKAEQEFQTALHLNPNYATAHHWYSFHLAAVGRLPEAIAEIQKAQELDPFSRIINTNAGTMFYYARQYDAAIEEYRRALTMEPNFWTAHWMLGLALEQKKQYRQAVAEQRRAIKDFRGQSTLLMAALARALALSGARKEAAELLQELDQLGKHRCLPLYDIALVHAALGKKDEAFTLLRKAGDAQENWFSRLKVDPRMDVLRSDPRYRHLEQSLRLPA